MDDSMKLLRIFLAISGLSFSLQIIASETSCEKVVVTGEPGWAPYSYEKNGILQGVGVDLIEMLFGELDIPIETQLPGNVDDVEHSLRHSRIDLIVGTYDNEKYRDFVYLVQPGYYEDAVSVVVSENRYMDFYSWYDLMGRIGLTSRNNQLGFNFTEFAKDYLYLKNEGTLGANFINLKEGIVDYLVGSQKFLEIGVGRYGKQGEFEFLPKLVSNEDVFFGFSLSSGCKVYAPYLKARAKELRSTHQLDDMLKKHIVALTENKVLAVTQKESQIIIPPEE
jgi:polar amino acid transport system substrate-binding protein